MRSTCRTNVANASRSTHRDAGSPKRSANAAVTVDYEGAYDEHVHRGPSRPSLRLLGRRARPPIYRRRSEPRTLVANPGVRYPRSPGRANSRRDLSTVSVIVEGWASGRRRRLNLHPRRGGRRKKRTLRLSRKHTVACWVPLRTEQSQPASEPGRS